MSGRPRRYLRLVGLSPADRRDDGLRVCVRCGWLVFDRDRCERDHSPAIRWKTAAKACRVPKLRDLLHLSPLDRLVGLADARDRLGARAEAGGDA